MEDDTDLKFRKELVRLNKYKDDKDLFNAQIKKLAKDRKAMGFALYLSFAPKQEKLESFNKFSCLIGEW